MRRGETQNNANENPITGAWIFLADIVPAPTNPPIAGANGPDRKCIMGIIRHSKLTANAIDAAFSITNYAQEFGSALRREGV